MFVEYLALLILILVLIMVFFTIIYLHDLPYMAAKRRNHPHLETIHIACWLSMFTLHALWPLIYIWALVGERTLSVRIVDVKAPSGSEAVPDSAPAPVSAATPETETDLRRRLAELEERLKTLESNKA